MGKGRGGSAGEWLGAVGGDVGTIVAYWGDKL